MVALAVLEPSPEGSWSVVDLLVMFAVTIVIVPLQSAGEEYGYRGLVFRVAASWGRGPRSALVLGVAVYPATWLAARTYVRQAERIEAEFADVVSPRSDTL